MKILKDIVGATAALALALALAPAALQAQSLDLIRGALQEADSGQPAIQVAVMLLRAPDSTFVSATQTNLDGQFALEAKQGDYILKFSLLGYQTKHIDLHKTSSLDLGTITLEPESRQLNSAIVTAAAQPITVKEDTVVYNAAAYSLAPDASLEELVRKLPGVELSSSGDVTLHGRPVTQLFVNGKRFFGANVRSGLKNLSAEMVENIKAYDRETDEARLSGIDDGEIEPVLDVTIRKNYLEKWRGTIRGGGGDQRRYTGRLNASRIGEESQISITGGRYNTNTPAGNAVTSLNQVGGGSSGDVTHSEAGFTFATRKKNGTDISGNFHYGSRDSDISSTGRSETVNASSNTFSTSSSMENAFRPGVKASMNIELHPTKQSSWLIKPSFQYDGVSRSNSSAGTSYYTETMDSPVNSTDNALGYYSGRFNTQISAQYTRKSTLKRRRAWSLRANAVMIKGDVDQFTDYSTRYYRIKSNPDSVRVTQYYTDQNDRQLNLGLQATWNEPLTKTLSLMAYYRAELRMVGQEKGCYDLSGAGSGLSAPSAAPWHLAPTTSLQSQLSSLPASWQSLRDSRISYDCSYRLLVQTAILSLKYSRKKVYLVAGAELRPQSSVFTYPGTAPQPGTTSQAVRVSAINAAPKFTFRYRFNKTSKLSVQYSTRVNTPGLTSLMPVVNGTNPLYVRTGNPSLKAPYVQEANISYNYSNRKRQNSVVCQLNYSTTENAISSSSTYDPDTGVRTYIPQNINGNWRLRASSTVTKTFGSGLFSLTNQAAGEFRNDASYLYNNKLKADEINNTARLMLREYFEGSVRAGWFEGGLGGGVNYTDERSSLRPQMRQSPLTYVGSASICLAFPWGGRVDGDFTTLFQRGYSYPELNKNYYILNLEASQRVFKGGVIRLCWCDALHSQENLTRTFSSSRRAVTLYNGVTSYLLLRFSYTFKER